MKLFVYEQQQSASSVTIVCSGPLLDIPDATKLVCRFIPTQTIGAQTGAEMFMWPVCGDCFRARLVAIAKLGLTPMVGSLCEALEYIRTRRATRDAT